MPRRIISNAAANYLAAVATVGMPVIALPFYLATLGPSQWGLVGLIISAQSLLGVLDAGLSQTFVREFVLRAQRGVPGHDEVGSLLHASERFYWKAAFVVAVALVAIALPASTVWLRIDEALRAAAVLAVAGAGIVCGLQLPGFLYRGVLVATNRQMALAKLTTVSVFVRQAIGVAVVWAVPSVTAYVLWHALSIGAETVLRMRLARAALHVSSKCTGSSTVRLSDLLHRGAYLTSGAILGGLTFNYDKLFLTRSTPVEQFGQYVIASQLATGTLQLIYPLTTAALPHIIRASSMGAALGSLSTRLFGAVFAIVLAVGLLFYAAGEAMLSAWLGSPVIAGSVFGLLQIMLTGVALNALANVGYLNWLARNRTSTIFTVNLAAVIAVIGLTPWLVYRFGLAGAAMTWIVGGSVLFIASMEWAWNSRR